MVSLSNQIIWESFNIRITQMHNFSLNCRKKVEFNSQRSETE